MKTAPQNQFRGLLPAGTEEHHIFHETPYALTYRAFDEGEIAEILQVNGIQFNEATIQPAQFLSGGLPTYIETRLSIGVSSACFGRVLLWDHDTRAFGKTKFAHIGPWLFNLPALNSSAAALPTVYALVNAACKFAREHGRRHAYVRTIDAFLATMFGCDYQDGVLAIPTESFFQPLSWLFMKA